MIPTRPRSVCVCVCVCVCVRTPATPNQITRRQRYAAAAVNDDDINEDKAIFPNEHMRVEALTLSPLGAGANDIINIVCPFVVGWAVFTIHSYVCSTRQRRCRRLCVCIRAAVRVRLDKPPTDSAHPAHVFRKWHDRRSCSCSIQHKAYCSAVIVRQRKTCTRTLALFYYYCMRCRVDTHGNPVCGLRECHRECACLIAR